MILQTVEQHVINTYTITMANEMSYDFSLEEQSESTKSVDRKV